MKYKYGEPDQYGDFPLVYESQFTPEQFRELLLERLPEDYPMQIVCSVEEQVLSDVSSLGIDSHLEGIGTTNDEIVDNKVGNVVVQRRHHLGFDKNSMICLLRRLEEYNPTLFDHSEFEESYDCSDYDWDECTEEEYRDGVCDFWAAAYSLRSAILSTLEIGSV